LIQITAGTETLPILRQGLGQPVPQIVGRPDPLNEILAAGGDIATRASETLSAARDLLTPENVASFSRTLRNLEDITAELAASRAAFRQAGEAAVAFTQVSREVQLLATDARTTLAGLDQQSSATLAQTTQTLTTLNSAVEDARGAINTLEATADTTNAIVLPEVTAAAQDLRRLSNALERVTVEVDNDPYGFLFSQSRPTVEVRP
jgi:phospholipid/cholesterol/gamma-HCH transport system substrate-binding protein